MYFKKLHVINREDLIHQHGNYLFFFFNTLIVSVLLIYTIKYLVYWSFK